jgi:hypothetical protein
MSPGILFRGGLRDRPTTPNDLRDRPTTPNGLRDRPTTPINWCDGAIALNHLWGGWLP